MDCRYFGECSAPICPKDKGLISRIWFPNDEICHLKDVPEWVKQQRKIAKTGANETVGCFTLLMLERHCVIKKGITGIDPNLVDNEQKNAEKIWLGRHSGKKLISDEEREKRAARGRLLGASRRLKSGQKTG
jgi:hypothetical protein